MKKKTKPRPAKKASASPKSRTKTSKPKTGSQPRPFSEWRKDPFERADDAAYAFGFHLIAKCREEALKGIPATGNVSRARVEEAVDTALHNVLDMFEGFWRLEAGAKHQIELGLQVHACDDKGNRLESHEISGLDLPIGYWKWARDREFR